MIPRGKKVSDSTRCNIVLRNSQIVFLTRLTASVRESSGAVLERSGLIRALIDALQTSGFDVTKAKDEEDLAAMLAQRLAGRAKPKKAARKSKRKG